MREQLASRRGIRELKRICWRAKPADTAESLYKQPIKPSAQVGTISPQTISRRSARTCQVLLPRQNWVVVFQSLPQKQKHMMGTGIQCGQIQMQRLM